MRHYYHLTSNGPDTNLQLYSLKQANIYWMKLKSDVAAWPQFVEDFHERCVFVVCTMGLSVSQLLGQNIPKPRARVDSPARIFQSIIQKHQLDSSLNNRFTKFINLYDQCRHFGLTTNGSRHWEVSQVEFVATEEHFEFGLEVWRLMINIYRANSQSDLTQFDLNALLAEP